MVRTICVFILLLLAFTSAFSNRCDSIIIKEYYFENGNRSSDYDVYYLDSLHRIVQYGSMIYQYDSLNRVVWSGNNSSYDSIVYSNPPGLIEDYFFVRVPIQELRRFTESHQGLNQKDSLVTTYYYSNGGGIISGRRRSIFSYTSFDSLLTVIGKDYNIVDSSYITEDSLVYEWTPDHLIKVGYLYKWASGVFQVVRTDSSIYNSSGEIELVYSSNEGSIPGYRYTYINSCGIPYMTSFITIGGTVQNYDSIFINYVFDSLCRPVSDSGSYYDANVDSMINYHTDYYYADCNNMLIYFRPTAICPGATSFPYVSIHGGTGARTYQWTPADSVSNPAILFPALLGETPQWYSLTVTDQAGNSSSDSIYVYVNSFTTTVNDATCSSCTDGSIIVNAANPSNDILIDSTAGIEQSPGVYMNVPPGTYRVCVDAHMCMTCDSITVNVITSSVDESKNNFLSISPNPFSEKIILHFKCDNFQNRSQWKLYESNGRLLKSGLINQKEVMIKTEDISNGIYFLQITDEKETYLMKMIKN
ncbi:MAG: T9SS type A sorting domain-containing protein [Bacteroidia bacterium]|nr:T9SS type A sorting domain-containing protein [Bacteroidia bacterium]MBP9923038.1 T9SS type A sorting domain-containing protein [Bacteroidia bacterium]